LEKAKQEGTQDDFQYFLQSYPNSDWKEQAEYFLEKLVEEASCTNKQNWSAP